MSFKICAFYTDDELYSRHAKEFEQSLKDIGISNYHIVKIPPIESWVEACGIKPRIILDTLSSTDDNVVYVDIDARFRSYPELFNSFDFDIGAHIKDGKELLSGTLFFRNNDKVKKLVRSWLKNQRKFTEKWDQHVLQNTINEEAQLELKLGNLPPAYCQIFDSMAHFGEPVIEHLQASREHPDKKPMPMLVVDKEKYNKLLSGEVVVYRNLAQVEGGKIAIKFV
ncbi:MAG: glycosyltransferase family 77 protein [Lentisphaeraceae bacterium]|nr:glycosyltransferase family 77 protein [Lentisphaeraceae bacterium]